MLNLLFDYGADPNTRMTVSCNFVSTNKIILYKESIKVYDNDSVRTFKVSLIGVKPPTGKMCLSVLACLLGRSPLIIRFRSNAV